MSFTLAQRVHELVNAAPDRPALGFRALGAQPPQDDVLTRVQLWRSACAFAAALDSLPANAGRHVMVVMPLGTRLLAAHLGILLHGSAASIFTHPSEKMRADVYARNLRHAVGVLRPHAVIVASEFLAPLQTALDSDSLLIVTADSAPHSVNAEPEGWRNACSDAIAVIQYSSGSTGLQKCVALSHEMVIGQCESYGRFIGLDRARDVVCSWLPLYHDMGLFTSWLMPVIHGVPVWMVDPFEWVRQPESILGLISDVRGTLCWQPNFAFRMLASRLGREQVEGLDLSSVRGFTNCSEPISARTTREFIAAFRHIGLRESSLWSCYAMAENAFAVTAAGGPQRSRA